MLGRRRLGGGAEGPVRRGSTGSCVLARVGYLEWVLGGGSSLGSLGVHEARRRPVRRVSEKESADGAGGATSDGDERDPAAGTQERR